MIPTTAVAQGRPNPTCWRFFDRLRAARLKAGLTREGLSTAAGLSTGAVSGFELRKGFPRLPTVEALAATLAVSPAWLSFGLASAWDPSDDSPSKGLARRFREARIGLGLSLKDVERRSRSIKGPDDEPVGVSEGTVRGVERGRRPPLDTLEKLANALGVSPAWLAYGEGPMQLPRRGAKSAHMLPLKEINDGSSHT